jgi:uncharacterized protein with NRDE domain
MCLLLFAYHLNSHCPFVLCSNRDEYFDRQTIEGSYNAATNIYSPIDVVAGGTWISFSGIGNGRFAVVLNFHDWRYDSCTAWRAPSENEKVSRGHLPIQFVSATADTTAKDFASSVCSDNMNGYNLIVGDSSGCYYLSNCSSKPPVQLDSNRIHGITNGHLCDIWPKVAVPRNKIDQLLLQFYCEDNCSCDAIGAARKLVNELTVVMQDSTHLPDATYGENIQALMQLSAVNVAPFAIGGRMYGTRTIIVAVAMRKVGKTGCDLLIAENTCTLASTSGDSDKAKEGRETTTSATLSFWVEKETILTGWLH